MYNVIYPLPVPLSTLLLDYAYLKSDLRHPWTSRQDARIHM